MGESYSMGEAKTQLSRLVRRAEQGEDVILCRGHLPVARIVPVTSSGAGRPRRQPGRMAGRIQISPDFEDWPADVAEALGMG
jgi:antitoxin (DNA-binding transcriptional repressor) of toxin-antitoxin stability system